MVSVILGIVLGFIVGGILCEYKWRSNTDQPYCIHSNKYLYKVYKTKRGIK